MRELIGMVCAARGVAHKSAEGVAVKKPLRRPQTKDELHGLPWRMSYAMCVCELCSVRLAFAYGGFANLFTTPDYRMCLSGGLAYAVTEEDAECVVKRTHSLVN